MTQPRPDSIHALAAISARGAMYIIRRKVLPAEKSFTPPGERLLDIDAPFELHLVDLPLKERCGA